MTRRLIQLLLLIALAVSPVGRVGAAQALAQQTPMAMRSHCGGPPTADHGKSHGMTADCLIACAGLATAPAPFDLPPPALAAAPVGLAATLLSGIQPEADPPPPRPA